MATSRTSPKLVMHSTFSAFSKKVSKKFRDMDENFKSVDRALASLNRRLGTMNDRMELKFDQIDQRFEQIDRRFDQLIAILEGSLKRQDRDFGSIDAELAAQRATMLDHDRRIDVLEGKS